MPTTAMLAAMAVFTVGRAKNLTTLDRAGRSAAVSAKTTHPLTHGARRRARGGS